MSYTLTVFVLLTLCTKEAVSKEKENARRILINDPNIVGELSAIKISLQEQQTKITQLENKVAHLESDKASLESTVTSQGNTITHLQSDVLRYRSSAFGAVYTRWGRKECPDNETELVYSGIVGGSHYLQTSAAAEYVCLPTNPTWNQYDDTLQDFRAKMYGAEYQENFYRTGLFENDVPCAVCRRQFASSVIMLPGRNQCHSEWHTEYFGYLASGGHPFTGHKAATQFVCLDDNPEVIFNSSKNENGKLFYMVEGICGSLSCPPYVNGRELTCSVCTK